MPNMVMIGLLILAHLKIFQISSKDKSENTFICM